MHVYVHVHVNVCVCVVPFAVEFAISSKKVVFPIPFGPNKCILELFDQRIKGRISSMNEYILMVLEIQFFIKMMVWIIDKR